MKKYILTLSIVMVSFALMAMYPYKHGNHEEIEKMKVAFLTEKLNLTVEEAQVFWPIYNEYHNAKKQIREEFKSDFKDGEMNIEELSESELQSFVDGKLDYERAKLEIKTKYHEALKEIFSNKKIALLYTSEYEFRKHIFKEMRERSEKCDGKGGDKK